MLHLKKDLTSITDLDFEDVQSLLDMAHRMKKDRYLCSDAVRRRTMALVFEKPSLRTRVTFEAACSKWAAMPFTSLRATSVWVNANSVPDTARNLARWVDVIVARTFAHDSVRGTGGIRFHPGHQRALGRRASLPGAGRFYDLVGNMARPEQGAPGLHRRWQQRLQLSAAVMWNYRRIDGGGDASRLWTARSFRGTGEAIRREDGSEIPVHHRSP